MTAANATSAAPIQSSTAGRSLHWLRLHLRRWRAIKSILEISGVTRLGKVVYEGLLLRRGIHDAVVMDEHLRLSVKSAEQIERIDHFYEIDLVSRILAVVKKHDVVWDVGANIGMVSMLLARKARDLNLNIHGFEPEPRNAGEFARNIELNGLGQSITAHQFGLAERRQMIPLYILKDTGDGRHSILPQAATGRQAVAIEVLGATDVIATSVASRPDVVKIDVEGAEMRVLEGMDSLLQHQQIRELFIELHVPRLSEMGITHRDVEKFFATRQYQLVWSSPRGTEIHKHYRRRRVVDA